jgi:hypothetical protein
VVALKQKRSLFAYWVAARVNGGNHVHVTILALENGVCNQSNGGQVSMKEFDGTGEEYPPLNDVLQNHLTGCKFCQSSLNKRPVAMGGKPNLCSEWFAILADYAQMEGKVNNVVARDEYGNAAPAPNPNFQ